jgi:alkyl hydroperoxide reductase subunit AhpF
MAILSAQDELAVKKELARVAGPVKLTVFASELGPETNAQTVSLVREVAALSDQLSVEVLNPFIEREQAAAYGVSVTPAVIVEGAKDYGIRFLGIPAGYEFANLLDAIVVASSGTPGLSAASQASLAGLAEDVTIKVFTTPT